MAVKKAKKVTKARKPAKKAAKKPVKAKKPVRVKKPAKAKKQAKTGKARQAVDPSLELIGKITHYFPHVNAAAVKLSKGGLRVGDTICLKGHTTDFKEAVTSIQLDRAPIQEGKKGMEIGLFVKERVRGGDAVYRVRK